jgi:hypothetical protein
MIEDYKSQLFSEIQTMLKYLAKTGKSIPTEISVLLKTLDVPNADTAPQVNEISNIDTNNLLSLHNILGGLCKPATPMSIDASTTWKNKTVIISSLVGFIGFLMIMFANIFGPETCRNMATCTNQETCKKLEICVKQENNSKADLSKKSSPIKKTETHTKPVSPTKSNASTNILISSLGGAFLGSAFYALYSASQYIKSQTFDPGYTQVYLIRLILGIFAGYLLANIITPNSAGGSEESDLFKYGPELLGVIGGFSAEAVVQILQRFSDTLVTVVKGSDKEKVKSDVEKAVSKKSTETSTKLNSVLTQDDPSKMKEDIKDIIKNLNDE